MSDTYLESLRRLNALCSRFERELRQGRTPDIGELLVEVAQEERGDLLRELLLQEWNARRRRQEAFGLNEYLTRFGEQRAAVESAWGQWLRWLHPPETGANETPGAEATAAVPPQPPGYEIVGVLGRGGMGVVYRARQVSLGREVALKMILSGGHAGEEERRRFLQEAEAIARVRHPGIVQVFDYGTHEGLPYFSLEYCAGGSLAERLSGTPLPPVEAARVVGQLASAMESAHAAGVIHRDLKPANVLLSFSGGSENRQGRICDPPLNETVPKITDFGLAKRLEGGRALTQTGAVVGTASYMPPEQARGERVGPLADVYALGAILYECLTGRPPFKAANVHETLLQVVGQEPVSPRQLNGQVGRDLETVCLKCLSKDPRQRYASAGELAEDLRRFVSGQPILAQAPSFARRVGMWFCHRDRISDAGFFSVWMILVVAGWALSGLAVHSAGALHRGSRWPIEDSQIPSMVDLAVIHFVGVLGGLFLPLFFIGLGALRGKVGSLWVGLIVSAVDFGLMVCCLFGVDSLLWLIDLDNQCGTPQVRFFAFGFPVVLFGLVVASYGIALVAYYRG